MLLLLNKGDCCGLANCMLMNWKNYCGKTVEELLDDTSFVALVKQSRSEECLPPETMEPEDWVELMRARSFILDMSELSPDLLLDEKDKLHLWQSIQKEAGFSGGNRKVRRSVLLNVWRPVAAVLVLAFVAGAYFIWSGQELDSTYVFSGRENVESMSSPFLVLEDGAHIRLNEQESEVVVLKEQRVIQIGKDSLVRYTSRRGTEGEIQAMNEIVVPYGTHTKMVLSDGTKVWLNAGSKLAFPSEFNTQERMVFLEGEAYFEVARDVVPFIVKVKDMRVNVLGTAFNISAYPDDPGIETVLLKGRVALETGSGLRTRSQVMQPLQKATFNRTERRFLVEETSNAMAFVSWKEGWYTFSNEGLAAVLQKMERYYNIHFTYDQEVLKQALPITGKLDMRLGADTVFAIVAKVSKVDFIKDGNSYALRLP